MKPRPLQPGEPAVRPNSYRAPDRAEWEKTYQRTPYPIPRLHPSFAEIAREFIRIDLSTLDSQCALANQEELHALCESVLPVCDMDGALCYFDASDGQFWVYPYDTAAGVPIIYADFK